MAGEPQRERIELVCPECGQSQLEPALVVSTVCRSCRAHLQVRDGRAIRRAQSITRIAKLDADGHPVLVDSGSATQPISGEPTPIGRKPLLRPAPAKPHWWRKWWFRPKPMREICCLGCGNLYPVVPGVQSSQCPKCCTYASFTNHLVEIPVNRRIETRGNVVIQKKGRYYGPILMCHDLQVLGELDAPVECTGELWFRRNARITHPMHCGLLRVPRGVKVEFLHPVTTRDARIGGEVRGEITCTGQATFERKSRFLGLVRASKLDLKPGARHEGSTEMLPAEAESML